MNIRDTVYKGYRNKEYWR